METQENLNNEQQGIDAQKRYLTFRMDGQLFGLHIMEIVQITQMQEIISLPEQPSYIRGIINLRSQIIPVMDMRLRFGKQEAAFTERTCIIITHVQDCDFGLIVDEVDEVVDILPEQISEPPKMALDSAGTNDYLAGIAKLKSADNQKERIVLLLHAAKILGEDEFACLSQAAENFDNAG